ncbi:MAG: GTP cyclohydrolase II [Actinobacteria bacterium]|nr:GTP cyclohydrolase II [Actinomycetota bacterium]
MVSSEKEPFFFSTIEETVGDIKEGKIIIIVDDKSPNNEGVLFQAAEKATSSSVNFFITHARGMLFLPCMQERLEELKIPMISYESKNQSSSLGALAVSIDARTITGSGISAADRAKTIRAFIDPSTKPEDISIPGHIFPLKSQDGGILTRAGHTEAAVDLAKIAGLYPAGIICEIISEDGELARLPELKKMSLNFSLKIITIEELIRYRKRKEKLIEKVAEINLPTRWGVFRTITYRSKISPETHLAFIKGEVRGQKNVLVRVHSQCLTGDTFGSKRCDCGQQLDSAFKMINRKGRGVLLYMAQEGRGIGLCNKMKAYELQEKGMDTVEANLHLGFDADLRDYGTGAQILVDLGLSTIKLMTNNPKKIVGLEGYGLKVVERIPIKIAPNEENRNYLKTKKEKLNHLLD